MTDTSASPAQQVPMALLADAINRLDYLRTDCEAWGRLSGVDRADAQTIKSVVAPDGRGLLMTPSALSTPDPEYDVVADAKATSRILSRRRPRMRVDAQPHASNLIEQNDNIETPADAERLRPHMARSARLMAAAR